MPKESSEDATTMTGLREGDKAPAFSVPDQDGRTRTLDEYAGEWLLLYFYPKDDTPGCTTEACTFRDEFEAFDDAGVTVVGVSTDSVKSHGKFALKHKLPFTLLADEEKKIVEAYGVWGKKKFLGREYMGTNRRSFLIDPKGKIAKVYEIVRPAQHAQEVLADVEELKEQ
jgi:thioredoxin-dependent peroxiredoxin